MAIAARCVLAKLATLALMSSPISSSSQTPDTPDSLWVQLHNHWHQLSDLQNVLAIVGWDQNTYMPQQATTGRTRQTSLLARLRHQMSTSSDYGHWLDAAQKLPELSLQQERMLAVARKDYDEATRLPSQLISEISKHQGESYAAWRVARQKGQFAPMISHLEKMLELSLQVASYFPEYGPAMDYFVQQSDEGMTSAQVSRIFDQLKAELVPLVKEVTAAQSARSDFLFRHYDSNQQLDFGLLVAQNFGYSFEKGRQDLTAHPFMMRLGNQDIRITTRVKENDLTEALYSTLHEAGHALYEQNISSELWDTPLGYGVSAGVHESQSRLWENQVGRSRAFWQAYFGDLREHFPEQLADVSAEEMYRAMNRVSQSLIRTDADELTYNLHVIIRFELEREMLEGRLAVRDLAEAWQDSYQHNLGLSAPDDADGVLQDVHWYAMRIGGVFQGYTIGNVMSAQFYAAAENAIPQLETQITQKNFAELLAWLGENVYQHGGHYTPSQLLQNATGSDLDVQPYLSYLQKKYRDIAQASN